MLETLYRKLQLLVQSDAFVYVLAGLFIVIWWAATRIVGLLRGPAGDEPRPRRRLPLR